MNIDEFRAYFANTKTLDELDDKIRKLKDQSFYTLANNSKTGIIEKRIYENGKVITIER